MTNEIVSVLIEKLTTLDSKILKAIDEDDLDRVEFDIDQRSKLIKILNSYTHQLSPKNIKDLKIAYQKNQELIHSLALENRFAAALARPETSHEPRVYSLPHDTPELLRSISPARSSN